MSWVGRKTSIFLVDFHRTKAPRATNLSLAGTSKKVCVRLAGVVSSFTSCSSLSASAASTKTGCRRDISESCCMEVVSVADRSSDCLLTVVTVFPSVALFASCCCCSCKATSTFLTSRSYPSSNILSASSSTTHSTWSNLKVSVFSRWSTRRPGVDIKMLTPFLILAFSAFLFSPPVSRQGTIQMKALHSFWNHSKLCTASSRVGTMTSARHPDFLVSLGLLLPRLCDIMTNERIRRKQKGFT